MRRLVIGGNWKLKINTIDATQSALQDLREFVDNTPLDNIDIFLALPYTTLYLGQQLLRDSQIALAAQNVHYDESGPYTGEISIEALKEFDVEYVLVGHSERRIIFEEPDQNLNKKVLKVLEHNLIPVFCIGETASQRNSGNYEQVLQDQLSSGLAGVSASDMKRIILAYEPVWAINNKLLNPTSEIKAATAEEAAAAHALIRSWLRSTYNDDVAETVRIQYGGSMNADNAPDLLPLPEIDGGLIGSASLASDTLGPIMQTAQDQT